MTLSDSARSNTDSYCYKSSYNTGNINLLGGTSTTHFQVSYYEVYQVLTE